MSGTGDEKSLIVSLAVLIQYTNVTDGRTDGHRSTAKTALCIASRGKHYSQNGVIMRNLSSDLLTTFKQQTFM